MPFAVGREQTPERRFSRYISKAFTFDGRPQGYSVAFTLISICAFSIPGSDTPRKAAGFRLAGLSAGFRSAGLSRGLSAGLSAGRTESAEAPTRATRKSAVRIMMFGVAGGDAQTSAARV